MFNYWENKCSPDRDPAYSGAPSRARRIMSTLKTCSLTTMSRRESFLHVSNPSSLSVILILPDEMKIDGFMRRDVFGPFNDALKYRTWTWCLSCAHIYSHIYSTIKAALANTRRFRQNVTHPASLARTSGCETDTRRSPNKVRARFSISSYKNFPNKGQC